MSSTRTGNLSINSCTYHLHSLPVSDKWSCGCNKHQSCWRSYHSTIFYHYILLWSMMFPRFYCQWSCLVTRWLWYSSSAIWCSSSLYMIILFLRSDNCFCTLVLLIRPQMSLRVFMLLIFLVFSCTFFFLFQFNVDKMCNVYKFWPVLNSLHLSLMLSRLCNLYKFSIFYLTY
jgi:hypothetical protein